MRGVGKGRCQNHFAVRGELDFARTASLVGQRDAPHLGVILRADQHLQSGADRPVAACELGPIFGKHHGIVFRLATAGLVARRPDVTVEHVTQKNIAAVGVAGDVLAPAGDGNVAPAAVSGARGGQHHRITAVRQQMRAGSRLMRRAEAARQGFSFHKDQFMATATHTQIK